MPKRTKEYFAIARQTLKGNRIRLILYIAVAFAVYYAIVYALQLAAVPLFNHFAAGITSISQLQTYFVKVYAFAIIVGVITAIWGIYWSLGTTHIILRPFQGEKPRLRDLLTGFRAPLKTLGNGLLVTFRCIIALLLCVMPVLVAIIASNAMNVSGAPFTILMIALTIAALCAYFAYMMGYCNVQLLQLLHPDMKVLELHRRSRAMMKNQRRRLLKLYLRMVPHILLQILVLVLLLVLISVTLYFVFPDLAPSDGKIELNQACITLLCVPLMVYLSSVNAAFIVELDQSLDPPAEPQETSKSDESIELPAETGDAPSPAEPAEDSITPEK